MVILLHHWENLKGRKGGPILGANRAAKQGKAAKEAKD